MATNTTRTRSSRIHTYDSLAVEAMIQAPTGFQKTVLGKGASATVYLGTLPENNRMVAVKRIKKQAEQAEQVKQFRNEVDILLEVNHANLVKFLGYCEDPENMALIYEFAEEGTVHDHLHRERGRLDWTQRLLVGVESARGIKYLHNDCIPTIYHRDIKSTNILLFTNSSSKKMVAKVADFGVSKNLKSHHGDYENYGQTHVSTRVIGTFGYLDPEYYRSGELRDKADIYSFGVFLLELVTGREALTKEGENLVTWVNSQDPENLPDEFFEGKYNREAMMNVINLAKACIQIPSAGRPSMDAVLRALESAYEKETASIGAQEVKESKCAWFCAWKPGCLGGRC